MVLAKDVANFVFTKIEPFAQYGFNKSHAAAYALIAYQTAYLKTYHKEDFIAATMSTELTNTSKLREFVEELKKLKIEIIKPSINKCFSDFRAIDGKLFMDLELLKMLVLKLYQILLMREKKMEIFKSFVDFINRVNAKDVNKLQLEGLVKAGVFDEFDKDRGKIFNSIPKIIQKIKNINDDKDNHQSNLFDDQENNQTDFEFLPSKKWSTKRTFIRRI